MGAESGSPAGCMLCQAERITQWFHEDETCWIAECEQCSVPMVVWKCHDPKPSDDVRTMLIGKLGGVVDEFYEFARGFYVDDNMRTIPHHYHAHARPVGGFFGHGLQRRGSMEQ